MNERQQNSTSYPIQFLMVDSSDHVTGKTGLSPTVTISKNGGGFASPSGAVTEVGNGWYSLAANATDRDTLGELAIHATATGADDMDASYTIVAYDPFDEILSTNTQETIREEVERLYGIRRWPVYGDAVLFSPDSNDHGLATWGTIVWDTTNSRWVMFYTAKDASSNYCINARYSTDGKTSWSSSTTVLQVGASGQWDSALIFLPIVWLESGTWHMYYAGTDSTDYSIGYATSTASDGLSGWTKSSSNPVLSADQSWEQGSIEPNSIIKIGSTYYMWYNSLGNNTSEFNHLSLHRMINYATSTDLTTWTKHTGPVFGDSDSTFDRQPFLGYFGPCVFQNGSTGSYFMICCAYGSNSDFTRLELWECPEPTFSSQYRRRVSIIAATNDSDYPNRDIDTPCIATDDVSRNTFTHASGEMRCYIGAIDIGGSWGMALITETSLTEGVRWMPAVYERVLDVLPANRWADARLDIADDVLGRGASNVEDTADTTSLISVILATMESSISGTTWTIKKTDGTTFVTKTVTTNASADPITGVT